MQGKGWLTWVRREKLSSKCGDTGWQRTFVPVPDHEPVPPSPLWAPECPVHTQPPALNLVCLKWGKERGKKSIKGLRKPLHPREQSTVGVLSIQLHSSF